MMWVRKQEAAAEWQEFASPAAATSKPKVPLNCAGSADGARGKEFQAPQWI